MVILKQLSNFIPDFNAGQNTLKFVESVFLEDFQIFFLSSRWCTIPESPLKVQKKVAPSSRKNNVRTARIASQSTLQYESRFECMGHSQPQMTTDQE